MRKAYGGAYIAMNSKEMGADMVLVRKLLRDSYEEEKRIASAMVNVEIFEKKFDTFNKIW